MKMIWVRIEPKSRKQKIQTRLKVMGLTAKQLCTLWGCTQQQFLYWIDSEHREIQTATIKRLAEMLGVPSEYITGDNWEGLLAPLPAWLQKKGE